MSGIYVITMINQGGFLTGLVRAAFSFRGMRAPRVAVIFRVPFTVGALEKVIFEGEANF